MRAHEHRAEEFCNIVSTDAVVLRPVRLHEKVIVGCAEISLVVRCDDLAEHRPTPVCPARLRDADVKTPRFTLFKF